MAPGVPTLQGAVSGLDWNLATCQKLGATEGRNLAAHTEQGPAPRDPPSPGCYLRRRTGTAGGSAARCTRTRSSAPAATPSGPPRTRSSRLPRTSTATAAPWGPRRRARLRLRTAAPLRDGGAREPDLAAAPAPALSGYGSTTGIEQQAARAPAHFTSLGLSGRVLRTPLPLLPSRLP